MGYTHYWQAADISKTAWQTVCADMAKLFAATPKGLLVKEYDEPKSKPYCGPDHLQFNGRGDAGHETFWINRVESGMSGTFGFCKTAHKPYDSAVVAALIYLAKHCAYSVSSDGDAADWQDGLALARKAWPDEPLSIPEFQE